MKEERVLEKEGRKGCGGKRHRRRGGKGWIEGAEGCGGGGKSAGVGEEGS